jgi:uncharacterized RDD family membrane protein YckC
MKMMGIRLDRLDGSRIDGLTAVVHSVLFWASTVILTPLVLLVTLFSDRKRTLHDLLLGTVSAAATVEPALNRSQKAFVRKCEGVRSPEPSQSC